MITIAEHTFEESVLGPESIVIDIGGYLGNFSGAILHHFNSWVECYEPSWSNFIQICIGLQHEKFTAYPRAVAADTGKRVLSVPFDSSAGNSIIPGHKEAIEHQASVKEYEVFTQSLSSIIKKHGRIDLLKLDCEGAEFEIIPGTSIDDLKKVKQITVEYHDFCFEQFDSKTIARCEERLKEAGFIRRHNSAAVPPDFFYWNDGF